MCKYLVDEMGQIEVRSCCSDPTLSVSPGCSLGPSIWSLSDQPVSRLWSLSRLARLMANNEEGFKPSPSIDPYHAVALSTRDGPTSHAWSKE